MNNSTQDLIQKSNEKWLNRKPKDPKETRRIGALLNSKHVRDSGWSGKQYNSVRG